MSRSLVVYARREAPLSPEDLLKALGAEGISVEWRPMGRRDASLQEWRRGVIQLPGGESPAERVDLSTNPLNDAERQYLATLDTGTHSQALAAARRQYFVSVTWSSHPRRDRVFETLAAIVAELADGVIHDPAVERYYDPREFRHERGRPAPGDA